MSFDLKLLEGVLVCTSCRSRLVPARDRLVCTNPHCRLAFEIRDEIPNMLADEARTLTPEEWHAQQAHCSASQPKQHG